MANFGWSRRGARCAAVALTIVIGGALVAVSPVHAVVCSLTCPADIVANTQDPAGLVVNYDPPMARGLHDHPADLWTAVRRCLSAGDDESRLPGSERFCGDVHVRRYDHLLRREDRPGARFRGSDRLGCRPGRFRLLVGAPPRRLIFAAARPVPWHRPAPCAANRCCRGTRSPPGSVPRTLAVLRDRTSQLHRGLRPRGPGRVPGRSHNWTGTPVAVAHCREATRGGEMRSRGWTSGQRRGATSHRRRLTRLTAVAS